MSFTILTGLWYASAAPCSLNNIFRRITCSGQLDSNRRARGRYRVGDPSNLMNDMGRRMPMTIAKTTKAILTDIHFLIPLAVLCIGVALLVKLY